MPAAAANPRDRRILVIEDETDIAALIAMHLNELPAAVTVVHDGAEGLERALASEWDAVVLDLRLPGMGGLDVCRSLRQQGSHVPLLMLTARGAELDRVLGLELGADDYLCKPFGVMELQARVRALWRRAAMPLQQPAATAGSDSLEQAALRIDRGQRKAWLAGAPLVLTPREFDLLWWFMGHPDRAVTRAELLDQVWGYSHDGYDHTVNTHINRLRSKLGGGYISTVWGVGYRFEAQS